MGVTNFDRVQGRVEQVISFYVAAGAATADFDGQLWISNDSYELVTSYERHGTAGAAANIQVLKVPSGTAAASGTNMLASAGHSAAGTANTNSVIGPSTTVANTRIVAGDSIAVVLSGASAALDAVSVMVTVKPI